jgi:hypothetical protein
VTSYNPEAFRQFASSLYSRAVWIQFTNTIFFAAVAGIAGAVSQGQGYALIGLVGGGLVGYYIAAQRAFELKYRAQTALCQAQVEENTRLLLARLTPRTDEAAHEVASLEQWVVSK